MERQDNLIGRSCWKLFILWILQFLSRYWRRRLALFGIIRNLFKNGACSENLKIKTMKIKRN